MYRCPSPLNGGAYNYVLICSVTDSEYETIADCNLCVPSSVLLLDGAQEVPGDEKGAAMGDQGGYPVRFITLDYVLRILGVILSQSHPSCDQTV